MDELIRKLREFARERDWDKFHSPKNIAMALSVEVAEICGTFSMVNRRAKSQP